LLEIFFSSGDRIMLGSRQTSAANPTRVSLAQFSKNLASGESRGQTECAGCATEGVGQRGAGQKRFVADVVAAMSNRALESSEEAAELPKPHLNVGH
jgi:hypothetical protein